MAKTWLNLQPIDRDRTTHYHHRTAVLHMLEYASTRVPIAVYTHYLCGGFTSSGANEPSPQCEGAATCLICAAQWSGRG